ncbi:amidohydrolase family protein [Rothia uropygioeca]|uniref:amidohydrolase family protein n=1 Tax=Kocuria sp. 257 TaxID=2021970 RepID=UPI001012105D|nr:amidohydrolase family protein [Kocuria sp. 257]
MTTRIRNVRLAFAASENSNHPVDVVFDAAITSIRPASDNAMTDGDVDGTGKFLLPGLIDTHVHLGSSNALQNAARAGVTTLVDLGTHPDSLIIEQRETIGAPAIVSAGSAASAPGSTQITRMGFPSASGVTGATDADRYLDWRVQNGSDLIKIIIEDPDATDVPALDNATLAALVQGAHKRGLMTVAHVVTASAFDRGLDAGVDILTHAPLDRDLADTTLKQMLRQGTISSPTLVMMRAMAQVQLGDRADEAFQHSVDSVHAMHAAGVPIVAGTDANETPIAPVEHGPSLHDEIAYLQKCGLTPSEALTAATSAAADAFGLSDRGRIDIAKRADLVLVDSDPTIEPRILRHPAAVWIAGVAVETN